jgi:hypothetical protein
MLELDVREILRHFGLDQDYAPTLATAAKRVLGIKNRRGTALSTQENDEIETQRCPKIEFFLVFPHIPMPGAVTRAPPSAVGLLLDQHGLSNDGKVAGRSPTT